MTLRQIIRGLTRGRSYSVAAVLTMAVGLAATTAVVAVANAVSLRPLPYPSPDRLFRLNASPSDANSVANAFSLSPIEVVRLQQQAKTLEQVEAINNTEMSLTTTGNPETLKIGAVSAGFLRLFGLQPTTGRDFTAEEDAQRSARRDSRRWHLDSPLWPRSEYCRAGDSTRWHTVRRHRCDTRRLPAAVANRGRVGSARSERRPVVPVSKKHHGGGATRAESDARRGTSGNPRHPATDCQGLSSIARHNSRSTSLILRESLYGSYRSALLILAAAVISLLLIGCTNVANLTLCRVLDRRGEFALRASLGASRASIVRGQLGETAIICVAGAAAGLILAWWFLPVLLAVYPAAIPVDAEVRIDLRSGYCR